MLAALPLVALAPPPIPTYDEMLGLVAEEVVEAASISPRVAAFSDCPPSISAACFTTQALDATHAYHRLVSDDAGIVEFDFVLSYHRPPVASRKLAIGLPINFADPPYRTRLRYSYLGRRWVLRRIEVGRRQPGGASTWRDLRPDIRGGASDASIFSQLAARLLATGDADLLPTERR
jgi:hypothetical protein